MGKDHEGDLKQYLLTSEAYYPWHYDKDVVDEVMFGFYSPDGGTSGEMAIEWHQLQNGKPPAPQLTCFSDAWHALAQFKDVIDAMAEVDDQDITPKEFCQLLDRCGFVDRTQRKLVNTFDQTTRAKRVEYLKNFAWDRVSDDLRDEFVHVLHRFGFDTIQ